MQDQWGQDFDWYGYHKIWCGLTDDQRRVGDMVGISEAFILSSTRRNVRSNGANSNETRKYAVS